MTATYGDLVDASARVGRKSVFVAYLLWFLLGSLGAHRLYLQRTPSGVAMLLLLLVGLLGGQLGFLLLGVLMIWVSVDMLLIPGMARACNAGSIDELEPAPVA